MVKNVLKLPAWLLALDVLGAIIAAVGIFEFIDSGGTGSVVFIVVGFLLMLPLILHILKLLPAENRASEKSDGEH